MSLVGSLEDLGLGDILQIVSLSRKSGLLMIHSEEGEGRIVFCDGLVRAAFVKGEPDDLRGLLVATGFVAEDEFERAAELAAARGEPLDVVIPQCTGLAKQRLDSLRREHIERAVFRIFSWRGGEFSFEVRDEVEPRDSEILLPTGINAQYLTMEATRMGDEGERSELDEAESVEVEPIREAADEEPMFSGESDGAAEAPEPFAAEASFADVAGGGDPFGGARAGSSDDEGDPDAPESDGHEVLALATAQRVGSDLPPSDGALRADTESGTASASDLVEAAECDAEPDSAADDDPNAPSAPRPPRPLIAVDPELVALEWQKAQLSASFKRVHIFQHIEHGVARIRQYLARGEVPVVLISNALVPGGVDAFVSRLKQLSPNMPVGVTWEDADEDAGAIPSADAMVQRPNSALIGARRSQKALEAAAEKLRADLAGILECAPGPKPSADVGRPRAEVHQAGLQRLRETSERMRAPQTRGEALSLVLEFASASFSRVAIFMVRDENAVGLAQFGLPTAGGPDAAAIRAIEVPVADVDWFRHAIEGRAALSGGPLGEGDRRLLALLGDRTPSEAYVAPIESGGHIVALLYADNLPDERPLGDTTILEIVLHEAGLALERALLERALARAGHGIGEP